MQWFTIVSWLGGKGVDFLTSNKLKESMYEFGLERIGLDQKEV
jgi:hypothetical protein